MRLRRLFTILAITLVVGISIALAAASTATTQPATSLTTTTALLNGTGNPGGESATGWFRISTTNPGVCTDTFGSRVPSAGGTNLGTGASAVAYSITANGLTTGTTYWFCAIVSNASGTSYGALLSFTVPGPPAMATLAPDAVSSSGATLKATGNPLGTSSTGWFRYATTDPGVCTDSFGTRTPSSGGTSLGTGTAPFSYSQTLSSLSPGTTYYYCAIGSNTYGTSFGEVQSFTTAANAPSVSTSTPSPITGSGATLRGSANPGGAATTAWFRYGTISPGACNDNFGTRLPTTGGEAIPAGSSSVAFTKDVTGLTPGATYYVCAIAQNSVGLSVGSVVTITTPLPPTAVTVSAYDISDNYVTFEGSGVPNRATTTGWFRYSSTNPVTCNDTFGSRAPSTGGTSLGSGTSPVSFTQSVSGLTRGATYYYCAITSSAEGTAFGEVRSVLMATSPTVTTSAATSIDSASAVLNASGDPNGATTTGWFRYHTADPGACNDTFGTRAPSSSGTSLGAVYDPVAYNRTITGLLPGVTYWYCPIVSNAYGTAFGTVSSLTTPPLAPSVSTNSVSTFTSTTATLRGTSTPNGAAATGWLRYSTVSPGTCNDSFGTRAPLTGGTSLGAGNTSVAFTEPITGLTPGTTYHVCAIAQNSVGITFGSLTSFTTAEAPLSATTAATSIGDSYATLNGTGTPNRATATAWFRYSSTNPVTCNDTFGSRAPLTSGTNLGSGTSATAHSQSISGLSPATTYYFCSIVQTAEGTAYGSVLSFVTQGVPTASTQAASAISSTAATLNGTGDPNGSSATGWFRYASTDPGACNDSFGTRAPSSSGTSLGSPYDPVTFNRALTGLLPGTTYYACAIVSNGYGTAFGNVVSFTTPAAAPTASTNSANNIIGTGATLRGSADPGGAATTGWFRYDTVSPGTCNDTFGTRAPALTGGTALGAANGSVSFTQAITGLTPGVTYHVCAIAESSVGKAWGSVVSFTTPIPPEVITTAATSVANTSVTLNGAANPNRASTTGWFRYSATNPVTCNDTFGSRAPTTGGASLGSGTTSTPYSESISGLSAGVTYYFCAIAQSTEGTRFGTVMSFTTVDAPRVTSDATSLITSTTAQLNGRGDPNGASTTGWFRYSTTNPGTCSDSFGTRAPTSSGSSLGALDGDVAYNRSITGLAANTTYYACAIANNAYGTAFGAIVTFTTLPTPASLPTVSTSSANAVTSATATLRGSATPNNAETTGWLRYGTSNPIDCNDNFGTRVPATGGVALGAGASSVAFTQDVTGLTPGTTYYVCAIAQNSVGTAWGSVTSFVTALPPTVVTLAASSITNSAATFNGSGTPNRVSTTAWFRYSATDPGACNDTFGLRSPSSGGVALGAGTSPSDYSSSVGGLSPDTTYYFCALASSSEGTSSGAVLSFRTPGAPVATTGATTALTATGVTLQGVGNPKGATGTGWFRYSTTNPGTCSDSFGTRAPSASGTGLGAVFTDVPYLQLVNSLLPGTTYYYCAIVSNTYGTSLGAVSSFTTPAGAPSVSTSSVNNIFGTSATLRGSTNPNGGAATGWFRYSTISPGTCNDTFGTRAPTLAGTSLGAGNSSVAFSEVITGLTPGATYYFCAISQNSVEKAWGSVTSFVTPLPPDATTLAATDLTNSSATLQGTANPNRAATTGWFRYAATNPGTCNDTFGSRAPATGTMNLGSGTSSVAMEQSISGLSAGVVYYYCAIAQSSEGTDFGEVLTLTTLDAPIVQSTAATAVTAVAATLNAAVNPNGASTTGWFRYATTNPGGCNDSFGTRAPTSSGTSVGSGTTNVNFERGVTGLLPGTTYWFCALATSAYGTSYGNVLSFTTPATAPVVTTNGATNVLSTSADLNGTANPNGAAATGWFRYDTTNPGICNDTFGTRFPATGGDPLGGGNTGIAFGEPLAGLTPGTTYYVCAIAQNGIGLSVGAVVSFTTRRPPTTTTLAATPVTATTAQLNGSVNPNGNTTTGWFRYSTTSPGLCNDTFGTRVPTTSGTNLGSGSSEITYNYSISDLLPGVTYHVCAIASSSIGTAFGEVLSFTTPALPPTVTTLAATSVGGSTATLEGSGVPRGGETTAWFRYATTNPVNCNDGFGVRAPISGGAELGTGNTPVPFRFSVNGLQRGVTYYACAIAENRAGITLGNIVSFTTSADACVADADGDGVCDEEDLCQGNDATGDSDLDGICNGSDLCRGNNATGDADGDGTCNNLDVCFGADATGDDDLDGVCDDRDLCLGTDAAGDDDLDGICDDDDVCIGDDTAGDADFDGVCDDLDACEGDDGLGDADADGVCEDLDLCDGDDASGDTDRDGVCNDIDFSVSAGTLSAGQPFTLSVRNAPAGRTVNFFVSTSPPPGGGRGPCAPTAPSVCVGISSPILVGSRVVSANGQASLTVTAPATVTPGLTVRVQAVWLDGANGDVSPVRVVTAQ